MFSHRIKNAIKFGTEARGFIPFTEEELRDMAEWLDAHPADGTYNQYLEEKMRVSLKRVEETNSIDGEVDLESGIQLAVYRRWEDPQWYLYSVNFSHGGYDQGVIDDIDERYRIPEESELGKALAKAVRQETTSWTPAL